MNKRLFSAWLRHREEIFSMATRWTEIKDKMEDHLFCMTEHLVKIYYYHDFEEYLHGWIASVRKGFERIPKDSKTNKFPTENQIFDYIWNTEFTGDPDGVHKGIVEDIINKNYEDVPLIEPGVIDLRGFRDFMKSYVKLLAKSISENGTITMQEIKNFIENYNFGFSLKE